MAPWAAPNASALLLTSALVLGMGCDAFPDTLVCEEDAQCVRDDEPGRCLSPGYCAFEDSACESGWRWDRTAEARAGSCLDTGVSLPDGGAGLDGGQSTTNACGGSLPLAGAPDDPCGPCDSGQLRCAGPNRLECEDAHSMRVGITSEGGVRASSVFNGDYEPELSVDGDQTTSWFSSGPEGEATEYVWTGARDDCIARIQVVNNERHSRDEFRTGYGFGQVAVQVRTADDTTVYSEVVDLPGTPDPEVFLEPDVFGRKVVLLFTGHEADDCGGFSELLVTAWR